MRLVVQTSAAACALAAGAAQAHIDLSTYERTGQRKRRWKFRRAAVAGVACRRAH